MTDRLYDEMRRYFYTTPSSYLDLLKLYLSLLDKKQQEIIRGRDRVSCGLRVILLIIMCLRATPMALLKIREF